MEEAGVEELGIEDLVEGSLQEIMEFLSAKQRVALVEGPSGRLQAAALYSWRAIKEITITIIDPEKVKVTQGLQANPDIEIKEEDFLAALKGVLDRSFELRSLVLNVPHKTPKDLVKNVGMSCSPAPQLRTLKITDSDDGTDKSPSIGKLAKIMCKKLGSRLEELDLDFFYSEAGVQRILRSCPLLQKLERKVYNEIGNTVTIVHGSLQELRICLRGREAYRSDIGAPNLRLLEVNGEEGYLRLGARGLEAMAKSLRTLCLHRVRMPPEDLAFLARFQLEQIFLSWDNAFPYDHHYVGLDCMRSWTAEGAPLKSSLKVLRLKYICGIKSDSLKMIGRFSNLEELELSGYDTLQALRDDSSVLKPILRGCERLKLLNITTEDDYTVIEATADMLELIGECGKRLEYLDVSGLIDEDLSYHLERLVFGLLKGNPIPKGRKLTVNGLWEIECHSLRILKPKVKERAIEQCREAGMELTLLDPQKGDYLGGGSSDSAESSDESD